MLEMADVVIIGAGASGGAVAWSLADTRMKIVCLEQGDWMKPTDYPSNGRDWEAQQLSAAYAPEFRGEGNGADNGRGGAYERGHARSA